VPGGGHHLTLRIETPGESAIYDPWPRGAGQMVTDPMLIEAFEGASVGRDFRRPSLE